MTDSVQRCSAGNASETQAAVTPLEDHLFCIAEHLRKPDAKRILIDGELWSVNIGDHEAMHAIADLIDPTFTHAQGKPEPSGTIWCQIAAIYRGLDAQDCAYVDREWAKWRGLTIAAQPPAAPVETAPHLLELRGLFKGMDKPDAPFHDHERSSAATEREDNTCYVNRSEVRCILLAQSTRDVPATEKMLRAIDALPIFVAADFRGEPQSERRYTKDEIITALKGAIGDLKALEIASALSRPNCGGGK